MSSHDFSAFCIAGCSSGSGKTTLSLALLRALARRGIAVQPFKCGPDYIDPEFHTLAAGRVSRNLDCRMMGDSAVKNSFARASASADCSLVEGVMGLFDSAVPGQLSGSTAETALTLGLPVILAVDCKGLGGSIAAIVKGFAEFLPGLNIAGVIANRVGSPRHSAILRDALALAKLPPLLGALPRNELFTIPERHLGLACARELKPDDSWLDTLADNLEQHLDIPQLLQLCRRPRPEVPQAPHRICHTPRIKLAVARDDAFHFYYEDNLELLREHGFQLQEFSPLRDQSLPGGCQSLYIGGGFPELFAQQLADNRAMRDSIRNFIASGGITYAECGGFIYLTSSLRDDTGQGFPLCDVIPATAVMHKRSRALGYRELLTSHDSFLGPKGTEARGHEFHWSDIILPADAMHPWLTRVSGDAQPWVPAGWSTPTLIASYIHIHFASNPAIVANWRKHLIPE